MKVKRLRKSSQAAVQGTCGAKTRTGNTCKKPAGWGTNHVGVGRCRIHGGATPTGADSPHFKHGLACRYLPQPAPRGSSVTEADLISAKEEIAGAMAWAEKLCQDPGPKPPLTIIAMLKQIVEMKHRAAQLQQALRGEDHVDDISVTLRVRVVQVEDNDPGDSPGC